MMRAPQVQPVRHLATVSIVEALEDDLERRVLDGEFRPGEHLREVELADEYSVGRHTLRAAFDGLVRRRLLERARNRGVFVRALTVRDLSEIYELRTALEVQAFRALAVRRVVPDAARDAVDRLRTLDSGSPWRLVVESDLAFHRAIVLGAGNARLARAHEDLQSEILLCLAQLVHGYAGVQQLTAEHTELLGTIERGRPAAAAAAIRDHLERATAWLMARVPGPDDSDAAEAGATAAP
jgi:DNA-binding GntR family transcriptional regulator